MCSAHWVWLTKTHRKALPSMVALLSLISPLGISYGHTVKIVAEGGYGYKGYVCIGLKTNF